MTFGELIDTAAFQAGIPDIDALGAWVEQEVKRRLDELTAAHKYDELYVQDQAVLLNPAAPQQQLGTYPDHATIQRLDKESLVYLPNLDITKGFKLTYKGQLIDNGRNTGPTRFFSFDGSGSPRAITVFPYNEIVANDYVRYNFWGKATDNMAPNVEIPVPQLQQVLLQEMVQEITAISGDRARYQLAVDKGKRSYARSFGVTEGGSMNR